MRMCASRKGVKDVPILPQGLPAVFPEGLSVVFVVACPSSLWRTCPPFFRRTRPYSRNVCIYGLDIILE